jgi:hypothetical protein
LLEREGFERLQYFTVSYKRSLLFVFLEAGCTLKLFKQFYGWTVEPTESSLPLLDFNKFLKVPGELLGDIIVIRNVSHIDEIIIQHSSQHVTVERIRITSNEQVVIGSVI